MHTTGQRHRRGELGVDKSDGGHDRTADQDGRYGTHGAGAFQPATGQNHPTEADHSAKPEGERVNIGQFFGQLDRLLT